MLSPISPYPNLRSRIEQGGLTELQVRRLQSLTWMSNGPCLEVEAGLADSLRSLETSCNSSLL